MFMSNIADGGGTVMTTFEDDSGSQAAILLHVIFIFIVYFSCQILALSQSSSTQANHQSRTRYISFFSLSVINYNNSDLNSKYKMFKNCLWFYLVLLTPEMQSIH